MSPCFGFEQMHFLVFSMSPVHFPSVLLLILLFPPTHTLTHRVLVWEQVWVQRPCPRTLQHLDRRSQGSNPPTLQTGDILLCFHCCEFPPLSFLKNSDLTPAECHTPLLLTSNFIQSDSAWPQLIFLQHTFKVILLIVVPHLSREDI